MSNLSETSLLLAWDVIEKLISTTNLKIIRAKLTHEPEIQYVWLGLPSFPFPKKKGDRQG